MKLSVSSGNSLDTLYLSMDGVPAQLPGLQMERRKMKAMRRRDDGRKKICENREGKAQKKNLYADCGKGMSNFSGLSSNRKQKVLLP